VAFVEQCNISEVDYTWRLNLGSVQRRVSLSPICVQPVILTVDVLAGSLTTPFGASALNPVPSVSVTCASLQ
jgi:hypothetical protein